MKEKFEKLIISVLVLTTMIFATDVANAGIPNLVGWWKLDEYEGGTATDSSGYGYDGTLVGVSWAPSGGKLKGAVSFDKNNYGSCIEIPTTGMTPETGTVALWAYLSETQSDVRLFFGHTSTPHGFTDTIQLYMENGNTQLNLGLGDSHRKRMNIATLSTKTWYHIALTWDGKNYDVYINGVKKTTGTFSGLKSLQSVAHIGNHGRKEYHDNTFQGFIDDVAIFDGALSENDIVQLYNLGVASFISEPILLTLSSVVREAEIMVKEQRPQEAITLLEKKITKYEQWREKNPDDIGFQYKTASYDLYLLLAKAKEFAGAPTEDVIAAYKRSVLRLPNSVFAFLWLFENIPAKDYTTVVKECLRNSNVTPRNIYYVTKCFESAGNWDAFTLFLDAMFSEINPALSYSKAVIEGLEETGMWSKSYLEFCQNKAELSECFIEEHENLAKKNMEQGNFSRAVEIYRDIVNQCGPGQDKAKYELKVCECLFNGGEYQSAVSELERFTMSNKASYRVLVIKAIMLKGQTYIRMGDLDKAINTFFTLMIEYPEGKQVPDTNFFIGYCYMLQGKLEVAKETFNCLIKDYPHSFYADKAQEYITRITSMVVE